MDERKGEPSTSETGGSTRDKQVFAAILVLGVAALFFGFLRIGNTIQNPFRTERNTAQTVGPVGATISELSKKDTDDDGLNDYDELYVYQTSPYLADSDGDSKSDRDEVFGSTDPNCPTGQTCSPLVLTEPLTNTPINATNVNTSGLLNTLPAQTQAGLSADELRVALRNAGAPEATLAALDDATLLELYNEITGESVQTNSSGTNVSQSTNQPISNQQPSNTNTSTDTVDIATLRNLTPDQIREFLIQGGADAETVNQVDDDTLREIFEQALSDLEVSP